MSDTDWLVVGGVFLASVVVLAILASAWRFERNSASYQKYLKREEDHQNREDALLARQEQLLGRIESLVEQLGQKFSEGKGEGSAY